MYNLPTVRFRFKGGNMETKTELKTFKVDMVCSKCLKGRMYYILTLFTDPEKYKHKCSHCGSEETYDEKYPKIEYSDIHFEVKDIRIGIGSTVTPEFDIYNSKDPNLEFKIVK
jgi:hypothetical protein